MFVNRYGAPMAQFRFIESSFIVRNVAGKTVRILGTSIKPGHQVDLFKAISDLPESTVLDELRPPGGALWINLEKDRTLQLVSYNLITLYNAYVDVSKILTNNHGKPGQVLALGSDGTLTWADKDATAKLNFNTPLKVENDIIHLPKADGQTNGFLSKEDWLLFKGAAKGLRIWQYVDIEAEVDTIKIDGFLNGDGLPFNPSLIVSNTAVVVDKETLKVPYGKGFLGRLFGKNKIVVSQHNAETVLLSGPLSKSGRVYFLVVLPEGIAAPENYTPPPDTIKDARIEYFEAINVDFSAPKEIRGEKVFRHKVGFESEVESRNIVAQKIRVDELTFTTAPNSNYLLSSNGLGDASWKPSPIVSSNSPANPYAGQLWLKLPEYELFVLDGRRDKWISISTFQISMGLNTTSCTNTYLCGPDNINSSTNSIALPFNAVLTTIIASGQDKQSWAAEVHVNDKIVSGAALSLNNRESNSITTLDLDFSAGSKIQVYVNGSNVKMPMVELVFRKII